MTGTMEYEKKWLDLNDNYVNSHPELKGFFNYLRVSKSLRSVYMYLNFVHSFLEHTGKTESELVLNDFLDFMAASSIKKDGTMCTSSHAIQVYHALKNYSAYLYQNEILPKDYMSGVKRPKALESQETKDHREKNYLDVTELKIYMENFRKGVGTSTQRKYQAKTKERDYAILMIFLTTGIRCSALVKLDINDVDMKEKKLRVTDKGGKVHTFELNDATLEAIKAWLIKRDNFVIDNTPALFLSRSGERLQRYGITEMTTKYAMNINGKNITPHKLRATYGTQLYNATKDIYFVQQAMGHSTPTVTELYVRGQKNVTGQASNIMSKLL